MIKGNQFTLKGFTVWGVCALFFLYEFFLRTVIGTFQQPIMNDLQISSVQFSLLSTSMFLLVYGLMQIPVGLIADNIGLKKSLITGNALCIISAFGFAYSVDYSIASFFRLLMGFGASFGFICLLLSVHDWMPGKYVGLFIGLSQFIGTLGPFFAAGPLDSLTDSAGLSWRTVFIYLGIFGSILLVLVIACVENNQLKTNKYIILRKPENFRKSVRRLFVRVQPWYIAFTSTCLYFSVEYLSENEGKLFLSLKGIDKHFAAYIISISWLGYGIANPFLGFLSDFIKRRRAIVLGAAICSVISILTIIYSNNKSSLIIAFFFLGSSAAAQSIGIATISEQFKKQFVAVGFGLHNAIIIIISAINAPLIGLIIDYTKTSEHPSLIDYQFSFISLIIISFIGLTLAKFFIKETYCKSAVDFTILNKQR
jgi:MFS family permease